MADGWSRVRCRAPGAGEVSLSEDAGTVPSGRRSLKRELKALLEDQARAGYDSGRQGRRESAEVPKESSQVIDNDGEDSPDRGFFGRGMGNELRNMLERFQGDWKRVLRSKRKQFVTETNAALRAINQKIGNAMRKRQEQRLKFYHEYYEQFLTLFWEWNRDVQKTNKEEEKLIILFHKQRDLFQKARTLQSQRLRKIKNLYVQFLKDVQSFEENQSSLATNEGKEFRQEMAKLRRKIVADVDVQSFEENQSCLATNERKEFRHEMAKLRRKIVADVDVQSFEENQSCLATNERKEFRHEMAKLRRKIVADVQRQELANIRMSLQCLLL